MKTRIPPHNEEAEKSVLGAILLDKEAINTVSGILNATDFYNPHHETLYGAMMTLFEEREPIDVVTLSTFLKKKKQYEQVGGARYLAELAEGVPTAANVETYAHLIKESATKRGLIHMAANVSDLCFDEDKSINDILDTAESTVFSIAQGNIAGGFVSIRDSLAESFERIDTLHKTGDGMRGVPTGFTDLDKTLSGLQPSNLLILAARPGVGKTGFALNMAQNIALQTKRAVGFFSLEMSKEELVDRMLTGQANIDAWRLKTGRLTEDDWERVSQAMGELADAKLFIDDTPGITINEMRTKARRLHLEHNVSLFVVDYLQLMNPGKKVENRVQEVSLISKFLKNLARELKVPVLALSQLNRSVEHRDKNRPVLADLRESGTIEQDADVVMFLYRPDEEEQINSNVKNYKLMIAKHRNGAMGEIDLIFRGDRVKFFSVDKVPGETS